jgi:hypothetical protein
MDVIAMIFFMYITKIIPKFRHPRRWSDAVRIPPRESITAMRRGGRGILCGCFGLIPRLIPAKLAQAYLQGQ